MDTKLIASTFIIYFLGLTGIYFADPQAFIGALNSSFRAAVSLAVLLVVLRWMDRRSDMSFKNWWNRADACSKSRYLSCRVIAVALIICTTLA